MTILVTGTAGSIGSNFVLDWLAQSDDKVINLDDLTYAGNLENLASLDGDARHVFVKGSIGDFNVLHNSMQRLAIARAAKLAEGPGGLTKICRFVFPV